MSDQSVDDRAAQPASPGHLGQGPGGLLGGPATGNSRRALWISLAALAAVTAIAVPVTTHLLHGRPAQLVTPTHLAGLTLDDQSDATATADYLRSAIAAGMGLGTSVGAVYTDGTGDAHSVIFVGGTTTTGTDSSRLTTLFSLLDDSTDGLTGITAESTGTLGGQMQCALSTDSAGADGAATDATKPLPPGADEMAVCGWADSGTVGIGLFPNRTVDQAATLLRQMRPGLQNTR